MNQFTYAQPPSKAIPTGNRISISKSEAFHHRLDHELRRSNVSGLGFTLVTITPKTTRRDAHCIQRLPVRIRRLSLKLRRTDLIGWNVPEEQIGILFTDIAPNQREYCNRFFQDKLKAAGFGIEYEVSQYNSWDRDEPGAGIRPRQYDRPLTPSEFVDRLQAEHRRYLRDGVGYVMAAIEDRDCKSETSNKEAFERIPQLAAAASGEISAWTSGGKQVQILLLKNHRPAGLNVPSVPSEDEPILEKQDARTVTYQYLPSGGWRNELRTLKRVHENNHRDTAGVVWQQRLKRIIDIAGSAVGLVVLSPLMAALAVGVKLSSPGPVLFRQKRVGRYGEEFTFLKFRSMKHGNDPSVHEKFVAELMALQNATSSDGNAPEKNRVYKLVNDSRITPFGRFIRKTSLDELPQLINVLLGQMSLVGPRPPIAYEVDRYAPWHLERLVVAKPGITGLWQVEGRSRVTFDEMVRLDLRYASQWSVWLDIKLLFRTIEVVLQMTGAR